MFQPGSKLLETNTAYMVLGTLIGLETIKLRGP